MSYSQAKYITNIRVVQLSKIKSTFARYADMRKLTRKLCRVGLNRGVTEENYRRATTIVLILYTTSSWC